MLLHLEFIDASCAATTCLLALLLVVSNAAKPASEASSVTDNLKAFFAPVSEFIIKENVPSPLSVTVAFTPSKLSETQLAHSKYYLHLKLLQFETFWLLFIVNVLPDQLPKSIAIHPN